MTTQKIFDYLVFNAPRYLKGIELTYEDAENAEKIMKENNLSLREACEIVYDKINEIL